LPNLAIPLVDDHQCGYITKLEKKTPWLDKDFTFPKNLTPKLSSHLASGPHIGNYAPLLGPISTIALPAAEQSNTHTHTHTTPQLLLERCTMICTQIEAKVK
jgi:hypothetical protein